MTNWNLPNKIFSVLMALVFITTPLTGLDVVVAENDDVNKSASVTFTSPMKNDKMEAVISSTDTDDNHAILGNHEGRECLITQWQRNAKYRTNSNIATIPFKVEDSYIGENDRHIAINITFFDHEWDTFRIYYWTSKGEKTSAAVVKYGTNTWRTATVLLRDPSFSGKGPHGSDFYFTAFETDILRITEYISKIEVVNLDKTYLDEKAESKTDILHFTEAIALNNMGIFDAFKNDNNKYGLDKPLTLLDAVKSVVTFAYGGSEELASATCDAQDVPADTKPYVGLALEKGIIQKRADGTVGAGDIITLRQLFNMSILAVKNTGYSDISDTLEQAKALGLAINVFDDYDHGATGVRVYNVVPGFLIDETNVLDRYAYMDDLAGVGYNMMNITISGNDKPAMAKLYERNVFTRDMIVASGSGELILDFYRQTGFTLVEKSYVDEKTGVTINTLDLPGLHVNGGYSHSQGLSADGKYIVACVGTDISTNYGHIAVYNRETKETKILNPDLKESYEYGFMLCAETNEIVYTCGRELFVYDLNTDENRYVATQTDDTDVWAGVPSVTADGELVCLFGTDYKNRKPMNIDTVNLRTGEITLTLTGEQTRELPTPDSNQWQIDYINHININPVYKNLYYYIRHNLATTGSTMEPPREVWTYNSETGEHRMISRTHHNDKGKTDEQVAHWVWSGNGDRNYFIKYYASDYITEIPGQGMVYVTKEGNEDGSVAGYINGDYPYNHMAVTPDDKWFVGDDSIQWGGEHYTGKVVLVDGETGKSRLLATDIGQWNNHPGHTHPLISDDGGTVYFTTTDDNFRLVVGYIDLTTLPEENPDDYKVASVELGKNLVEKGIAKYDEFADRYAYSQMVTKTSTVGGKSCLEIPSGMYNPFDVYPHYVGVHDNVVTMQIEYYDNGTDPIVMEYNSNHLEWDATQRDNTPYRINRTGTNQWLVHEVTLKDVSFRNAQSGFGDFMISAASSKLPVYIKSIRMSNGESIPVVESSVNGLDFENTIKAFTDSEDKLITVNGNYSKEATSPDGQTCIKLYGDQNVSFAIDDSVQAKGKGRVSIAVTYYDLGKGAITIEYNADKMISGLPRSRDYMKYTIKRTGTNRWKTDIIELEDADFKGRQINGADFRITASNSNLPIYIKQVELLEE